MIALYKEIPLDILKRDNPEIYQMVFDHAVLTGEFIYPKINSTRSIIVWRDEVWSTDPNIEFVMVKMPRYSV